MNTAESQSSRIRILVVNDWPDMAAVLVALFRTGCGYDAIYGGSSSEAVAMLPRVNPDIVTTDVKDPPLNGQGVIDAVKQFNPRIPVIVISGYEVSKSAQRAKGAAAYISFPFKSEALEVLVRKIAGEVLASRQ